MKYKTSWSQIFYCMLIIYTRIKSHQHETNQLLSLNFYFAFGFWLFSQQYTFYLLVLSLSECFGFEALRVPGSIPFIFLFLHTISMKTHRNKAWMWPNRTGYHVGLEGVSKVLAKEKPVPRGRDIAVKRKFLSNKQCHQQLRSRGTERIASHSDIL